MSDEELAQEAYEKLCDLIETIVKGFSQEAVKNCEAVENKYRQLLQKTQQLEDNSPLTWDELKQMEGKPVWITEMISGRIVREYWDMVCIFQYAEEDHIDFYKGPWRAKIELDKTWNAYRRERK